MFMKINSRYTMKNTKLLSLTAQNLQDIPETILDDAKTAGITCIDLSKNKLKELPDKLALLPSVEDLKLGCNQLTEFPHWLGESYHHLSYLDLSRNLLTTLPESVGLLARLREINVSFNKYEN